MTKTTPDQQTVRAKHLLVKSQELRVELLAYIGRSEGSCIDALGQVQQLHSLDAKLRGAVSSKSVSMEMCDTFASALELVADQAGKLEGFGEISD